MRRKLSDRRVRQRFDVVGDLWGTLETEVRLVVKNIGRGGVLIQSHVALAVQSVCRLTFTADGEELSTPVTVRRVDAHVSADGERTYMIGAEFVAAQPALLRQIDRWLAAGNGAPIGMRTE